VKDTETKKEVGEGFDDCIVFGIVMVILTALAFYHYGVMNERTRAEEQIEIKAEG
jgi:hypothetical protein